MAKITPGGKGHYGDPGSEVPADLQAEILRKARNGVSRNAIVRQTGVATAAVSGICARAGVKFDPSRVEHATRIRTAEFRERRAELSARLLEEAAAILDQVRAPVHYLDHGGKDFVRVEWDQDEPTPADKLRLMQTAATAIGRHLNLELHDTDSGHDDAKSMLQELGRSLGLGQP